MLSLLNNIGITLLEQGYQVGLNWLGQFARIIIEGVGIIGLGIVVFTLVLKAITLPFDIVQRVKMRKQNLIMRDMKDDLEKLQQQYANDKDTYSAKMMELYKKNGYSMFGACLPTILSLVILIVAFSGFSAYSKYANLKMFADMSLAFNEAVLENSAKGTDYTLKKDENGGVITNADGTYILVDGKGNKVMDFTWKNGEVLKIEDPNREGEETCTYTMTEKGQIKYFTVTDENCYLSYFYNLEEKAGVTRQYEIDPEMLAPLLTEEEKAQLEEIEKNTEYDDAKKTAERERVYRTHVYRVGALAAKETYTENKPSFLWVKNVWYPDVSYNHPVPTYSSFKSIAGSITVRHGDQKEKKSLSECVTEEQYNTLTMELESEKKAPNGYFILIVLSIGMMVLSQFITMRSQKDSTKYQSVDGQGATTQKMMLVMMPVIYAIFAFLYSAAFSIYMLVSSILSLAVTLLSNLILDRMFHKKETQKLKEEHGRTFDWMEKKKKKGSAGNGSGSQKKGKK